MARLYQKIDGEAVPLGGGGGSSVDIDNITITKNLSSNKIQVADAITTKVNELNNTASDVGKILTANGDGTASWANGYVEGFYGTTAEWNALSYAQQKAWIQKNPKVTFTDDYVSNIKQTVDGCISSTNENDVVGASVIKEANTYDATERVIGEWFGKPLYRKIIYIATLPGSDDSVSEPIGVANIDAIVNCNGIAANSSIFVNIPFANPKGLQYEIVIYASKTHVTIETGSVSRADYHAYVRLEYTKTTD